MKIDTNRIHELQILVTEALPTDLIYLSLKEINPPAYKVLASEKFIDKYYGYFVEVNLRAHQFYLVVDRDDTFSFECIRCGECCRSPPFLLKKEVERIKKYHPRSEQYFQHYLELHKLLSKPELDELSELCKSKRVFFSIKRIGDYCAFFNKEEKACDVYPSRPFVCRARPLLELKILHGALNVRRMLNAEPLEYEEIKKIIEEQREYRVSICQGILNGKKYKPLEFIKEGNYLRRIKNLFYEEGS